MNRSFIAKTLAAATLMALSAFSYAQGTYSINSSGCKSVNVGPVAAGWGSTYIYIKSSNCNNVYKPNYGVSGSWDKNKVAHFYNRNGIIVAR